MQVPFRDRRDAAERLAAALAGALGGELDAVLVRKLGAPGSPELAVGALDETGRAYVADFAPAVGAAA